MKIVYRLDILKALKLAGYNSTALREKKIFGQATIQRLREGKSVSFEVLAELCVLLNCDISDILMCLDETSVDSKFIESVKPSSSTDKD